MVGAGLLMIAVSWWAAAALLRKRPPARRVLRALAWMSFSGWIATLAGWYVTETGRQPWIIYKLLTVGEVVAPHAAGTVAGTLVGYALVYAFLLVSYVATLRYMATKPAASLKLLTPVATPRDSVAETGA